MFLMILVCIVTFVVIVSLGLIDIFGVFLLKYFLISCRIFGILVELLINIILFIKFFGRLIFLSIFLMGCKIFWNKFLFNFLKVDCEIFFLNIIGLFFWFKDGRGICIII